MKRVHFISTVVPGANPNRKALKAVRKFCKLKGAKMHLMVSSKVYKEDVVHPDFMGFHLVDTDFKLNDKIKLSSIPINPQAIDPVTGLDRQLQKDGSFIFASPKQRMKVVPNSNIKLPLVLMTTGALTKPYYKMSRNGIIAATDHVNGGIIVETVGPSEYHYRQVQFDNNGNFIDLGVEYTSHGSRIAEVEALVPGDWHAGETDPVVEQIVFEMLDKFKPKHLVLHDFFNGLSVNHHIENKHIARAKLGNLGSLEYELNLTHKHLQRLMKKAKNIAIVRSNHDVFLDRWLEEAKYYNDPTNHIIGLELALAKANGHNPFEYYMRKKGVNKNVRFLGIDEDFKLTPLRIQLGAHGHVGSNGARATTAGIEKAYGKSITGHSHTPEILRGSYVVGTSTVLKLDYNSGPSSWMNSLCILYSNGSRQLVNIINGRYHG